jgi:hypothetical protein
MEAVTDEPVEMLKEFASWNRTTGCVVKATAETAPAALVVVTILVAAADANVTVVVATVNEPAE